MSRPYAEVIGDPIAQSKSPTIHNFWLAKLGIDAEYRRRHVRAEELADYFSARNGDDDWRGCNITMPHKQSSIPFLDRLDEAAERIGAVNTVTMEDYYLVGCNTDAPGFLEPLLPLIQGRIPWASLVGAGGAAKAIADALYWADFSTISYSRDPAKAAATLGHYLLNESLFRPLSQLTAMEPIEPNPDRVDVLVNASPLGMTGFDKLDVDFDLLTEGTIVYDIVTDPIETPLLVEAKARGFPVIDGLAMLIGQAAAAFELFFGQPAPREHDAELRALLTA